MQLSDGALCSESIMELVLEFTSLVGSDPSR